MTGSENKLMNPMASPEYHRKLKYNPTVSESIRHETTQGSEIRKNKRAS
jgi:hypothetical protein